MHPCYEKFREKHLYTFFTLKFKSLSFEYISHIKRNAKKGKHIHKEKKSKKDSDLSNILDAFQDLLLKDHYFVFALQ